MSSRIRTFVTLAASGVLTLSVLAVLTWSVAPAPIEAAVWLARHGHGHGHHGRDACAPHAFDAETSAWLERELDLDDAQAASLQPMLTVAGRFHDEALAYCDVTLDDARASLGAARDLSAKLTLALDDLIVAFDGFYATLDTEQRERLDGWLRWPHRHD